MLNSGLKARIAALEVALAAQSAITSALDRSTAVVELGLDGRVLSANDNLCAVMGYDLAELAGRPHADLCAPEYVQSAAYRAFWDDLRGGRFFQGRFRRRHASGRTVWLEATYNPVVDGASGRVTKVIKFAADITSRVEEAARSEALVAAIERAMAVIEFSLDGRVPRANDNFLQVMGYAAAEVVGNHHRMFCRPAHADSEAYRQFWQALRGGRFMSGLFERVNRRGEPVWLEASYNPVLDADGRIERVVKTASDVTAQVKRHHAERDSAALARAAAADTDSISRQGEATILDTVAKMRLISQTVESAVQQVAALGERTAEISSITNTIKEISDQTNLLALNAAIESARAGESGRGFAVVVDEVRALAERTTRSTAEISRMVDSIQSESRTVSGNISAGLAQVAGDVIKRILEDARRVVEVVERISQAVGEGP